MMTEETMKKYVSNEAVLAKPMSRLEYNNMRGWPLPEDENGEDEGFLVELTSTPPNIPPFKGYITWLKKDVFDRHFRLAQED